MITREALEEFFEYTRGLYKNRKCRYDIDDVCRWSFFFTDSDSRKLLAVVEQLEADGYEFAGLLEPGPDSEDQETIFLRCDRLEKHTIESLNQRTQELYEFASNTGLRSYDGMDVGHVDGP